jgi:hypothetical protein
MRYAWVLLGVMLIVSPGAPAQQQKQKQKKAAPKMDSLTGCVDEKTEVYILRTDDALKELATLEPVGFDKTNFARFVGHKVTVSGQLNATTTPPTMRVSSLDHIKNLSDMCIP